VHDPVDMTRVRALAPDVIVLELLALGSLERGWAYLAELQRDPDLGRIPLILCTSASLRVERPSMAAELDRLGVRVVVKPCRLTDLKAAVETALREQSAADE
jgi:hypothetical protein